jgi:hypothetical protein
MSVVAAAVAPDAGAEDGAPTARRGVFVGRATRVRAGRPVPATDAGPPSHAGEDLH